MKKVIIADDNKMVVESLSRLIPWETHGYEIVATAFNGRNALKSILEFGIDILITDIKMPGMDGLELIREIRKMNMEMKAIVLSSYNDFDLVREAMRLGASEYILKTELEASSLIKLLGMLSNQLEQEQENLKRINHDQTSDTDMARLREADNELFRNRRHIKDQLFRELCLGYLSEEQFLMHRKDYLNIRFRPGYHAVLYLAVDNFQKLVDMRWKRDEQLLSFAIMNVMGEVLDEEAGADLFYNGGGEFVIMMSLDEQWGNEAFTELFDKLSNTLDRYLRIQISGGLSKEPSLHNSIPALYLDAIKACQFRFVYGKGKLTTELEIQQSRMSSATFEQGHERINLLRNTLAAFHPKLLERTIESLCVHHEEVAPDDFNEVLKLYEKYSFVILDFIEQHSLKVVCGPLLESFNEFIYDREAIPELNRRLKEIITRICESMESGNSQVRQLIKYVQAHYQEEITLQSAAEVLGVSSPYLGRLVQKELAINFNDYLNNYRIERAKELLIEGSLKIYEIADKVGYGSVEHFSRVFKKLTGLSPKDFSLGKYM